MDMSALIFVLIAALAGAYRIDLPPGVQVEGMTQAPGSNILASDIRTGAIYLVDVRSGLTTTAVRGDPKRQGGGLFATKKIVFQAGGGIVVKSSSYPPREDTLLGKDPKSVTPALYAFDLVSGKTLAACEIEDGGFVNDVIADDDFAYFTDSFRPVVYKLSLKELEKCQIERIPLPLPDFKSMDGIWRANGIEFYKGGLLVTNLQNDGLYYVDLRREDERKQCPADASPDAEECTTASIVIPPGGLIRADGLWVTHAHGEALLYVAQDFLNLVSVWRLEMDKKRAVCAIPVRNITSPDFQITSTLGIHGRTLVTANSRFTEIDCFTDISPDVQFTLAVVDIDG